MSIYWTLCVLFFQHPLITEMGFQFLENKGKSVIKYLFQKPLKFKEAWAILLQSA